MSVTKGEDSDEPSSLECWDYSIELECLRGPHDLQLAAELGKTLLQRNKELETALKQHQNVIEDQAQQIEYLTKQSAAMKEVNDSRLRIYEQLEISLSEMELMNQKLSAENITDKKLIKSLSGEKETLDGRCEELQRRIDELTVIQESALRRQRRSVTTPDRPQPVVGGVDEEEVLQLLRQVQELKSQRDRDQRRATDLEDQLSQVLQENAGLAERVAVSTLREEEMESLQKELSTLEEIRQGHLCRRCLRGLNTGTNTPDYDDDVSVIDSLVDESQRTSVLKQLQESLAESCEGKNPYRELVDKYEDLLKVQRVAPLVRTANTNTSDNCMSLQDELLLSGEFFTSEDIHANSRDQKKDVKPSNGKVLSATPTEYSETETSSSGFSDETSNKGTQTDATLPPGSFLCTISDGDDCRFSIYDDASPVESRFRKTPEYRQLFREIFAVLKRAAEAKDEGEKLPLLDDYTPVVEEAPKVPPVTPAREEFPSHIPDPEEEMSQDQSDLVSLEPPESVASSFADIPCGSTPNPHRNGEAPECCDESIIRVDDLEPESSLTEEKKKPRDYLEYLSSGVGHKKKSSSKKRSGGGSESTEAVVIGAKVVYSNKVTRRKNVRITESAKVERQSWCGETVSKSRGEQSQSQRHSTAWDSHFTKAASQVATLRLLDKSYAEVLRQSNRKKSHPKANGSHRN